MQTPSGPKIGDRREIRRLIFIKQTNGRSFDIEMGQEASSQRQEFKRETCNSTPQDYGHFRRDK